MISKEITYRAIEFRDPPRVPISYFNRDFQFSDTHMIAYQPTDSFVPDQPGATEWGYTWVRLDGTMGQPDSAPLADPGRIHEYLPPDPMGHGRLRQLDGIGDECADKFIKFSMGITGFNQASFLRGFDDFLMDLHCDRQLAEQTLDIVFEFENRLIARLRDFSIDAVVFADDWGTQQGLIVSPELWRAVFRPRYAAQFQELHRMGKKVWLHTCGDVYSIIGELIDIGVDVLELLQPDLLGVERLGMSEQTYQLIRDAFHSL